MANEVESQPSTLSAKDEKKAQAAISKLPLLSAKDEERGQTEEMQAQMELALLRKRLDKNSTKKTTRNYLSSLSIWTGFKGKTLWDWLQLVAILAIPLVVVGATIIFSDQQASLAQSQQLEQEQASILQIYLDDIQDLLLNHNLLNAKPTDDVAILARARTLTALQGLDSKRKGRLVQFLYEARLIGFPGGKTHVPHAPIINLYGADLSGTDLTGLLGANLSGADLSGADLSGVDLSGVDLSDVNLTGAKGLTQQQLSRVRSCDGATLPAGLNCTTSPFPSYISFHGTLVLSDPMVNNSLGLWEELNVAGQGSCQFSSDGYHIKADNYYYGCLEYQHNLTNFVFQAQVTLRPGSAGGLSFRDAANEVGYYVDVSPSGHYSISSPTNTYLRSATLSPFIPQGQRSYLIAIVAKGNQFALYVNGKKIDSVTDNTSTHGFVGLYVTGDGGISNTEAIFTNVKVWSI